MFPVTNVLMLALMAGVGVYAYQSNKEANGTLATAHRLEVESLERSHRVQADIARLATGRQRFEEQRNLQQQLLAESETRLRNQMLEATEAVNRQAALLQRQNDEERNRLAIVRQQMEERQHQDALYRVQQEKRLSAAETRVHAAEMAVLATQRQVIYQPLPTVLLAQPQVVVVREVDQHRHPPPQQQTMVIGPQPDRRCQMHNAHLRSGERPQTCR